VRRKVPGREVTALAAKPNVRVSFHQHQCVRVLVQCRREHLVEGPTIGEPFRDRLIAAYLIEQLGVDGEPLDLPVIGQQHAPHLVDYLASQNINVVEAPENREAAIDGVKSGRHDVVVIISETFGEDLSNAIAATVEVITDQSNTTAERESRRAIRALSSYNQELAMIRLSARGVSPGILRPLNIDMVDVSTPSGRSALLLGMLS
jgi:sodium transport system permease protein